MLWRCLRVVGCFVLSGISYAGGIVLPIHTDQDQNARILSDVLGEGQLGLCGHYTSSAYTPSLNRIFIDEALDAFGKEGLSQQFNSVIMQGCGTGRVHGGQAAISEVATALDLTTYGFLHPITISRHLDGERLGPREVAYGIVRVTGFRDTPDPVFNIRYAFYEYEDPTPHYFARAEAGTGLISKLDDPFEMLTEAEAVYIQHRLGTTVFKRGNYLSTDPLERLAGSHSTLLPEPRKAPEQAIRPMGIATAAKRPILGRTPGQHFGPGFGKVARVAGPVIDLAALGARITTDLSEPNATTYYSAEERAFTESLGRSIAEGCGIKPTTCVGPHCYCSLHHIVTPEQFGQKIWEQYKQIVPRWEEYGRPWESRSTTFGSYLSQLVPILQERTPQNGP